MTPEKSIEAPLQIKDVTVSVSVKCSWMAANSCDIRALVSDMKGVVTKVG
jgi:hypothetical protein